MIAIIPARGGSKRIPRKNIRAFLGKPIIAYAIETALATGLFEKVMVSTDDPEIADIARTYGASVPFLRSAENANDHATTFAVIEEVYTACKALGWDVEQVCCIYPCTPLLRPETIRDAYEKLNTFDSVYPVVPYGTPIQRALKADGNRLSFFNPEYLFTRSQDLEKAYYDPGQFYWMNTAAILEKKSIFTDNTGFVLLDELYVQDIDNEQDWKIAELKYTMLRNA